MGYWYDLSYWYGERPLTGLLGAAAWLENGWSLEEYGVEHVGRSGRKRHRRVDLWLGRGTAAATVEAKTCWIDQDSDGEDRLRRKLRAAKRQLKKVDSTYRIGQAVSVCYVVPCYREPGSREKGVEALTKLEQVAKAEGWATAKHIAPILSDAVLTNLVEDARRMGKPTVNHVPMKQNIDDGGLSYPGVLLVAKKQKWRKEQQDGK